MESHKTRSRLDKHHLSARVWLRWSFGKFAPCFSCRDINICEPVPKVMTISSQVFQHPTKQLAKSAAGQPGAQQELVDHYRELQNCELEIGFHCILQTPPPFLSACLGHDEPHSITCRSYKSSLFKRAPMKNRLLTLRPRSAGQACRIQFSPTASCPSQLPPFPPATLSRG